MIVEQPHKIDLEDIIIEQPPIQTKLKSYKSILERKKGGDSPEPLPLFDCIFCVGIHEHLVTQTVKEKQLKIKYSESKKPKDLNQTVIEEDDFYQEIEMLHKLFVVNLMAMKPERKQKETSESTENYRIPSFRDGK